MKRNIDLYGTAINYRLKPDDIKYIFEHAEVDIIIVDHEFVHLLDVFRAAHPQVHILIDDDTSHLTGPFDKAVEEGVIYDHQNGGFSWSGLAQITDENAMAALSYTSGTTSRPKGVVYTHRSVYLAAMSNVVESGLYSDSRTCRYLWTLPMFHATGMLSYCFYIYEL